MDSAVVQTVLERKIPIGTLKRCIVDCTCVARTRVTSCVPVLSPHPEVCLTSNIKGGTVPSLSQHHLGFWLGKSHPCVLCVSYTQWCFCRSYHCHYSELDRACRTRSGKQYALQPFHIPVSFISLLRPTQTDDKGVFSTTLSEEYKVAADTFSLSKNALGQLSMDSIQHIFDDDCKALLGRHFHRIAANTKVNCD